MTAPNPNPGRITDAQWRLWLALKELEPGSQLGGLYAFKRGYHSSRTDNQRNWPGDYSIRGAEDQGGPADKCAAFDWTFPNAQRGDYTTIAKYTKRLLASGKDKDDPRLDGWREFYGQADSDRHVEGWDCRFLTDITSDSSHLWHIHGSEDRNLVESWENKLKLLSVLKGESVTQWRATTGTATPAPVPPVYDHKPGSRVLKLTRPQMTGDDVKFVQRWIGPGHCGPADGVYGPGTVSGVRWYQRLRGIAVDGECGPATFRQMGVV
jgi:peptidoglycan hydrolase-like protein with peptidoglycan-binding domain